MVVASRKKSGSARGRASDGRKRPESTTARTKGAKVSKPPNFQPAEIVLKELSRLPGLQMRDGLDESHVKDLFDALQAGKKLPRCKVFKLKDGRVVLTDGFHRCAAYERAGIEM